MINNKTNYMFKFTVIMAVYNIAEYLEEAIESLVAQTVDFKKNVQLILVNDGSTDESQKICEAYQNQYPHNVMVINKKNGGVSSTRNAGLPYVRGRLVNFMDGDDQMSEDALLRVNTFFVNA